MHGLILLVTISTGQPPGQVLPFGPGGGELFEAILSWRYRGGGGGSNKKNYNLLFDFVKYSGTRLIRTPRGHAIVSVLSRCLY